MPRSSQNRRTPCTVRPAAWSLCGNLRTQALGIASGMAITLLLLTAAAPVSAAPPEGAGYAWKLIFDDEFRDSSLNTSKWSYNYPWGDGHTHNHDAYCIADQVTLRNGKLVITGQYSPNYNGTGYNYISGVVTTSGKFSTRRGYIEGRFDMPDAIGSWPAFWTLQSGWPPEIDIMEFPLSNYDQRWRYWWNYHYGPDWQNHWSYGSEVWLGSDLTTGFHTYAVDWTDSYLRFRFDDAQKGQVTDTSAIGYLTQPNYLLVNYAVGGWPGTPTSSHYPDEYLCNWVRVWRRDKDSTLEITHRFELNETSGTLAHDSSGHRRHATLQGGLSFAANSVVGPGNGRAIQLDGVDDYIDLGDGFNEFDNGFTVTLWARPTAVRNWARFIDLGQGENNDNIYLARYGTTNDLTLRVCGGGSAGARVTATNAIQTNLWQFFAATIDEGGNVTLYKNGSPLTTGTTTVPWGVERTECYAGRSNWSTDEYFQGGLDDIRIYDYDLSAAQIQAIYQAGSLTLMAPANGATNASPVGALSWQGRYDAAAWDLYLGTDETAVTNADLSTYVGRLDRPFYVPEIAFSGRRIHYWRIDEVAWDGTTTPGPVWRFTPDLTGEAYVENPGFEIPATVKQTTANVPGWNDGGGVEKGGAWSSWRSYTQGGSTPLNQLLHMRIQAGGTYGIEFKSAQTWSCPSMIAEFYYLANEADPSSRTVLASQSFPLASESAGDTEWWAKSFSFTAPTSGPHVGKRLGIQFRSTADSESWFGIDDVVVTGSTDVAQWPYGDVARQVPGKIEAEDYDGGGQNYAYYDTSAGNSGGAYREDDVDIMAATDGGQSGYGVWAAVGEWMEYTVDVAQGEYVAHMRVASYTGGQTVRLLMDGQELGSVTVPATGGISTFQTVATTPFALAPGQGRVLRVVFDGGGVMWNWVELTPTDACAFAKAQPGWTPLSGDANEDCVVDALDLAILLAGWPGTYDLVDFAALAKTWLEENAWQ